MGLAGKYDFPGIKKQGVRALNLVLSMTGWGSSILASPFHWLFEIAAGFIIEWLANKGLIIINLGAIVIDGAIDQKTFDSAMDEGLKKVLIPGLSDQEKDKIDENVMAAFRNFAHVSNKPTDPKS